MRTASLAGCVSAFTVQARPSFDGKFAVLGILHDNSVLLDDTTVVDPIDAGPNDLRGWSDPHGVGGQVAVAGPSTTETDDSAATMPYSALAGESMSLEIGDQNREDNPEGDGEEIILDARRLPSNDNRGDNLRDTRWPTLAWFAVGSTPGTDSIAWSLDSTKYQDSDCRTTRQLGWVNRDDGTTPRGKPKLACHPLSHSFTISRGGSSSRLSM